MARSEGEYLRQKECEAGQAPPPRPFLYTEECVRRTIGFLFSAWWMT